MTNYDYLIGTQIGKVMPYLAVFDPIPTNIKIKNISNNTGNGSQYQNGYLFPEELKTIDNIIRTFYIDFEQVIDPLTEETHHKRHISVIIDIPYNKIINTEDKTRLILISSPINSNEVLQRYLLSIKAKSYNYTKFPFDKNTLKKLFLTEEIYTTIHEIKSTQRYLRFHYSGMKIISSLSDDIRLDPDLEHILDEDWKSIKIKLCRIKNIKAGVPPKIQMFSDGYFRLWNKWSSQEIIYYIIHIFKFIASSKNELIDKDKLKNVFKKLQKSRQFMLEHFNNKKDD